MFRNKARQGKLLKGVRIMNIKELNKCWGVPTEQEMKNNFDPIDTPSVEFLRITEPKKIPFGDTNYSDSVPQYTKPKRVTF